MASGAAPPRLPIVGRGKGMPPHRLNIHHLFQAPPTDVFGPTNDHLSDRIKNKVWLNNKGVFWVAKGGVVVWAGNGHGRSVVWCHEKVQAMEKGGVGGGGFGHTLGWARGGCAGGGVTVPQC